MSKYLMNNSKMEERAIQQRAQTRVANRVSPQFESEIMSAYKRAAKDYSKFGSEVVVGAILDQHGREMQETVQRTWVASGNLAGDRLLGAIKCAHGQDYEMKSAHSVFGEIFRAFIFGEAAARAVGLSLTTIFAIRQIIQMGKRNGDSVDKIADRMVKQGSVSSKYRAMMIARTESHAAYNIGRQAAAESSDLQLSKEWVSANDGRTRTFGTGKFSHRAANGELVALNQMFVRTGESLRFPGDPSGSAGNIIHCRCATVDVLN